ncbi:MAG: hypothetical protein J6U54_05365 [Clostridiales bacterium]|nr:hypothetical protein [Clostridiales bacterium]
MFWNKKKTKLDNCEDDCYKELEALSPYDADYGKVVDNLKKLEEIKDGKKKKDRWITPENVLRAVGYVVYLGGLWLVLNFEKEDGIITTKAFSLLNRPKF